MYGISTINCHNCPKTIKCLLSETCAYEIHTDKKKEVTERRLRIRVVLLQEHKINKPEITAGKSDSN